MGGISSRLRGLWREINAYGGRGKSEYDAGYERGIECALDVLEAAGFSEGKSTAADKIDADAAFMEEVREVLEAIPGALNGAFAAGSEEREGGSARRQERHAADGDALKARARALLEKMEGA